MQQQDQQHLFECSWDQFLPMSFETVVGLVTTGCAVHASILLPQWVRTRVPRWLVVVFIYVRAFVGLVSLLFTGLLCVGVCLGFARHVWTVLLRRRIMGQQQQQQQQQPPPPLTQFQVTTEGLSMGEFVERQYHDGMWATFPLAVASVTVRHTAPTRDVLVIRLCAVDNLNGLLALVRWVWQQPCPALAKAYLHLQDSGGRVVIKSVFFWEYNEDHKELVFADGVPYTPFPLENVKITMACHLAGAPDSCRPLIKLALEEQTVLW